MDAKRALAELREKVEKLDLEILERLEARARLSKEIRSRAEGDQSVDVGEGEWLSRLFARASGDLPRESLEAIFRRIRAEARSIEQPVKVAYVAPEGDFCHQAALGYFGVGTALQASATTAEALEEVARGRVVFAVFPLESSVSGLDQASLTALGESELVLVGERSARATYDLMGSTSELSRVERVCATAAAKVACQRFIERELARATIVEVRSSALAAELASKEPASAAIVPEPTGSARGLQVLRENVRDDALVYCRFGIAGQRPAMRSGNDVSCLLLGLDDAPGSLFAVLRHFAERGINVKKLQSLAAAREGAPSVVYVEIGGHVTDRPVVTALESIKRNARSLRVLGSFPASV